MDIERVAEDGGTINLGHAIDNPWSCEPKLDRKVWGRITQAIGGSTEANKGPTWIIGGSAGVVELPSDTIEVGASRVIVVEEAPSSLTNTHRSSSWTEGVASGAYSGGIGYVGTSNSYSYSAEADLAYPLCRVSPLACPRPFALHGALPWPWVKAISAGSGSLTDHWALLISIFVGRVD